MSGAVSKMQHIKDDVITNKSLKGTTLLKCLFRRMGCYFVLINSVGILQTSVKFLTGWVEKSHWKEQEK